MLVQNLAWSLGLLYATASGLVITPSDFGIRDVNNGSNSTSGACELGSGKVISRSPVDLLPEFSMDEDIETLEARAPRPRPLATPDDFGGSYTRFLEYLQSNSRDDNDIDITPTNAQLETWKVGSRRNQIPVGATGLYYRFGKHRETWKMRGMSGCTATIIASERGMWAAHLWESTRVAINGGSAFLKRLRPGDSAGAVVERPDSEFKAVGVDILSERTPSAEKQNRAMWRSLADLESSRYGDPFSPDYNVDGFVFTKAMSATRRSPRYSSKINMLRDEYQHLIPQADFRPNVVYTGTASQYPRDFPVTLIGVLGMQYTPCQRVQSGRCIARFEAWAEYSHRPVIVKEWVAIQGTQV